MGADRLRETLLKYDLATTEEIAAAGGDARRWARETRVVPEQLLARAEAGQPLTLGRYAIAGPLGRGGMGLVLRAADVGLRREVALKVLPPAAGPEELHRLRFEAQAMARLEHPNVVRVHGLEEVDGLVLLVMELVRGPSLERLLAEGGPLGERQAWRLLDHLSRALDHAAGRGLLHRDVKPGNVLTETGGDGAAVYRLCDFGLARALDPAASLGLTQSGALLGTPLYASPEQLCGAKDLDPRTDMFAVGLTVREALTGEVPGSEAEGYAQLATLRAERAVPDVRATRPEVSADLAELLRTLTAIEREARPASWREVLARIEARGAQPDEGRPIAPGRAPGAPRPGQDLQARTFGRYEVVRELARGGHGLVFRARDPLLRRDVALKVLAAHRREQDTARRRFEREIRALARLEHPNIVEVHDVGVDQGRPYLVMELVEGETLDELLVRGGPLSNADAARTVRDLARAVAHAHDQGVLHRDLKPENVLVAARRGRPLRPRLVDFGLVKDLDPSASRLSRTGVFMGSPGYWAPEQARGDVARIAPTTDVFGLGGLLYACLTGGLPPHEGTSLADRLAAVDRPPRPPSARRGRPVDPPLEEICLRALATDPADRYASAHLLADDLDDYLRARSKLGRAADAAGSAGLRVALAAAIVAVVAAVAYSAGRAAPTGAARGAAPAPSLGPPQPAPASPSPTPGERPAPPAAPSPSFPPECDELRDLRRLRLTDAWGSYPGKHMSLVTSVTFSPDGEQLASASLDGAIYLWSADDGRQLHRLRQPGRGPCWGLQFSPDGSVLLAGVPEVGTIAFDVASGEVAWRDEVEGVAQLGYVSAARWVVGPGATIEVWEEAAGDARRVARLKARAEDRTDMTIIAGSPEDGRALAASGPEVFLVAGERPELVPLGSHAALPSGKVWSVALRGSLGVSTDAGGILKVWDVAARRERSSWRFARPGPDGAVRAQATALTADGRVITATDQGGARVWSLEGELLEELDLGHSSWTQTITLSADGRWLASGSNDGQARIHALADGRSRWTSEGHAGAVSAVALLPDGGVVSGGFDGRLRLWRRGHGQSAVTALPGRRWPTSLTTLGPGAVGFAAGSLVGVWPLAGGPPMSWPLPARAHTVFRASADTLASVDASGGLASWRWRGGPSGRESSSELGPTATRLAAPAGQPGSLSTAGDLPGLSLFDLVRGEGRAVALDDMVTALAGAGAQRVLCGTQRGAVIELAFPDGSHLELGRHEAPVTSVVPLGGSLVASAAHDGLRLWSAEGVEVERASLAGASDAPASLASDGERVLVVGTRRGVVLRFELLDP